MISKTIFGFLLNILEIQFLKLNSTYVIVVVFINHVSSNDLHQIGYDTSRLCSGSNFCQDISKFTGDWCKVSIVGSVNLLKIT